MGIVTRFWVLTQKGNDPLKLSRRLLRTGDLFVVRDDGQIGHSYLGVTNWSKVGLSECTREENSSEVTLPRIRISGSDDEVIGMVTSLAVNLVNYSKSFMGSQYVGVIDLIDLWCHRTNTTTVDIALAYSQEDLDLSRAEQVPDFLGWTGLPGPPTCTTCQRWHSNDPAPLNNPSLSKFTSLVNHKPCWELFDSKGCSDLVPLGTVLRPLRYERPWVI